MGCYDELDEAYGEFLGRPSIKTCSRLQHAHNLPILIFIVVPRGVLEIDHSKGADAVSPSTSPLHSFSFPHSHKSLSKYPCYWPWARHGGGGLHKGAASGYGCTSSLGLDGSAY